MEGKSSLEGKKGGREDLFSRSRKNGEKALKLPFNLIKQV